jgi:hypothetical protein
MTAFESPDYQVARNRIKRQPGHQQDGRWRRHRAAGRASTRGRTPRIEFMQQASRAFDTAESQNAGNPCYQPYPAEAHRHLGLIAEAVLADRAAIREAVASAMAAPSTAPGVRFPVKSGLLSRVFNSAAIGESVAAVWSYRGGDDAIAGPRQKSRVGIGLGHGCRASALLATTAATPAIMRGREMPGWLRVSGGDLEADDQLTEWVSRAVRYARSLPPKQ